MAFFVYTQSWIYFFFLTNHPWSLVKWIFHMLFSWLGLADLSIGWLTVVSLSRIQNCYQLKVENVKNDWIFLKIFFPLKSRIPSPADNQWLCSCSAMVGSRIFLRFRIRLFFFSYGLLFCLVCNAGLMWLFCECLLTKLPLCHFYRIWGKANINISHKECCFDCEPRVFGHRILIYFGFWILDASIKHDIQPRPDSG